MPRGDRLFPPRQVQLSCLYGPILYTLRVYQERVPWKPVVNRCITQQPFRVIFVLFNSNTIIKKSFAIKNRCYGNFTRVKAHWVFKKLDSQGEQGG